MLILLEVPDEREAVTFIADLLDNHQGNSLLTPTQEHPVNARLLLHFATPEVIDVAVAWAELDDDKMTRREIEDALLASIKK